MCQSTLIHVAHVFPTLVMIRLASPAAIIASAATALRDDAMLAGGGEGNEDGVRATSDWPLIKPECRNVLLSGESIVGCC